MGTRQRRTAAIPLCGVLLLAVAGPLAACSGGSSPAAAGAPSASTVIGSSSATGSQTGSTGGSTAATTAPTSAATTGKPPAGGSPSPTIAAGGSHTATTSRPVTAAGAANGRLVPSCKPAEYAQHAGVARGALQTYLFTPYAAGTMRTSGTAGALALLHGGQAVRFSTQQLVAARGLLATCPRPVGGVVQAVDEQVAALRALWATFEANHVPSATSVAQVRSAQAATTAASASARMPLPALVPTAVQIQTG